MTVRSLGIAAAISIAACVIPRQASADLINSRTGLKLGETVASARGAWWRAYSKVHGSTIGDYVKFVKFLRELEKQGLDGRQQKPAASASTRPVAGQIALALVGEASVGFGNGGYVAGLGGARVGRAMSERAIVFGQALAGLVHTEDGNAFSLQPGGGLYFIPGDNTPAIALQLDFPIDMYGWGHTNGIRVSAGVIFNFR
jgi:hypothetical protein